MKILSRKQWGARTDLPRLGHRIGAEKRTEVFIHHTVIVDTDDTANEWEDLNEVRTRMRQLQTIRADDLGADVPYSMVAFCMANGKLVLCEGRGLHRTGAHTKGHNRSAIAIAFQGNFETLPLPDRFDQQLMELGVWLGKLRREQNFTNLGAIRPGDREVWGHQDVKLTACPGKHLFARLSMIQFLEGVNDQMMDKATWKTVQRALQRLDPPLYRNRGIDGLPGSFTNTAVRAFERRVKLETRGVMGPVNNPAAGMWPATRELIYTMGKT